MNTDIKIINKIVTNQILQYMKRIIYHDQAAFIPGTQGSLTFENKVIHDILIE